MGIADPDYYGIAMYLKVGDDTIELNSDKLESVVRIDPEGNEVEPQVTADNIYQFVHDGWGGPGEYTMRYTLKDGRVIEAKINVVSFEFKPVVLDGELVPATDYPGYDSWKDAITEDGIDFSKITQAQAIKMGIADPDYYGIAMYLKVGDDTIELNSDKLESVVRIDPEGNEVEPQVTADNIYQFVHDGWGGPGEYTMRYTLKDGRVIEAKINVVSFEFKPVVLDGELVPATDYPGYDSWKDAITEDGIDFSKITQAQAIKMGIADPDYYGIAMYLKVGDDTIELNSDNLKSVVRIDPEGNEVEPQVTADNIYQFVHDGWGGPGEYTMRYTLKDGRVIEAKINVVSFEFKPVVLDGELVPATDYPGYDSWKDAITEDGIDFSKITQAQAIKMGIADPDYYGIAMYLKVGDDTIELNSDKLESVVRIDPEGNEVEPQVTADNIYQFVHDGWGGPGEYTMRYTLKDGRVIEAKINVVSFEFKPVVLDGELVPATDYPGYDSWKDAITEDGIDFSKITQAQAIKMGIADPDYYGIAMYLKVGDDTIELNSDKLESVVRIDPEGNEVEPQVTADNIYQFVHDGWGGPGEYTMRYTLKDGRVIEAKINVVSFEFKPVVLDGELVPATDYPGYDSWKDAITEDGIDFSKITQAQAIKMGIADPDYYGIAMYLKVGDDTIELNSDKLESVVRIDPEGNEVEPQVTADNIYQFVHDGWGGPGEYTMRYTLKDGRVIEAKINVVSFEFKDEEPEVKEAEWKDTGIVGTNTIDGKAYVFQGFELLDAEGKRIDLVANNIESMTVLEPGASEPKTLTVGDDSDPLLWFNVQKDSGEYKYTVVTKAGVTYVATLNWTAPAEVDAVKTGDPAYNEERENWYQLYTVAVDVDPEDSKVYQIKPDGEISELTVLADADNHLNIWFRLYGKDGEQQEGEHIFLIKKGDTWSKAVINYGHATATWKDTGIVGTNTIDGKAYVFQGFELLDAEGKRIDLVADNIAEMTVLEPGASEPKTLTVGDDSDPLLWFNVQKDSGEYKYTVVTKAGVTYVATLNWTAPAEVDAVKTGEPAYNEERENWYQLYTVAVDVDPEDSKVYQIKPDGEISELTVLADADNHLNIWFRLYGKDGEQQEGEHIFLIKKGDTWSKAVINYGHATATWKDTGIVGTNTIDGKAYVFQGFELLDAEGKRIDLVANNIESMTVLEPGASEPKTLTVGDDSDPLLWFNVQKDSGEYKYTVVTKAGVTYVATLNWTAPAEVDAVKTGEPAYNEERENWYQLYTVAVDVDPEDSKVYQIKPDGEISELTVLADADNHLNIWFRLYGKDGEQQEGEHIFLIKKGDTWSKAVINYGHATATWKDTGIVGTNTIDGKAYVFQGFELLDAEGKRIDLVANNIESMTVLEPGASEPKTLTVGDDSDPLLWFNVQKDSGEYKYTVVTKAGVTYVATLNWTAPAEVDAVKTGDPAYNEERGNWYQLYTVAVDVDPEDSKVYQIKPDGEISELTVLADADNHLNIWFRLYGKDGEQQEGEHIFLIKKGDTWSKAVINYGHATATWKDTGIVGTNTIDGKAYVFQGFELLDAEGKRIDLVADNIAEMTVLEPGASEPKTLTVGDDSDPLLWFNVQKDSGEYKYTVVTKAGVTYVATLNWTAPAEVDAVKTGDPAYNEERENWYQLYTVAVDVDPEDSKVYQIKPDGEISELTVLADADNHLNIWFRLYGKDGEQQEGEHIFLIKKGDTWSKAVINYGHATATWKDTGIVGTNTIDGKAYVFQGFELLDAEGKRIDLVANNIESMTVLEPGASEPKTLTVGDDSDPLLWFNVQKDSGEYKYTVVTKAGVTYVATLNWTAPAEVDAVKTGDPAYNEERENWYQLYTVAVDVDPEDSKVYQIKPDGEISELTVLADADNHLNIWFRLYGKDGEQQEGEHIFLIKKGDTWSKAVINYGHATATWKDTGIVGTNTIDGKAYVFQGFELLDAEGKRIDLVADNIAEMTVLEPGASEPKKLTVGDDSDPLLWFNVQKDSGEYKYTVVTKAGVTYVATLNWTAPAEVDAVKTGEPAYNEERENWYQLYTVAVDVDPEDSKVYQIKPDGEISELTVLADADNHLNIWFRLYGKDGEQQEGEHIFLIKKGDTWSKAVINYGHATATWKDTGIVGTNTIDGKAYVFQGFELLDAEGKRIDLVANNIESMTVLEPGASEPKTLTVGDDSDPLLWFNVQKDSGEYKYTVVTKAGVTYVATLNWTAPAEVDAVKTGDPAYNEERENWYQLYTVAVDVDPEDSKVYQIKPDGEISELTVLADADNHLNIWFRLYGKDGEQQEGEHIFLIKKGDTWSKAVIDYGLVEVARADGDVTQDTGFTGGKSLEYDFVAEGKVLTIDAKNTKLPYYEEDGSYPPRGANWVGVAIPVPEGVDKDEVTATINGTECVDLFFADGKYMEYIDVKADDLTEGAATYEWVIKWGSGYADETITVKLINVAGLEAPEEEPEPANLVATGSYGIHDNKVYAGYELQDKNGAQIPLVESNIESMSVKDPDGNVTDLTVVGETDPYLWFNIAKEAGTYTYTVVTKGEESKTYKATLTWTAPTEAKVSFQAPESAKDVFTEATDEAPAQVDFSKVTADKLLDWTSVKDGYYAIELKIESVDLREDNVKYAFRVYGDGTAIEPEIKGDLDCQYVTTDWELGTATMYYVLADGSLYQAKINVVSLTPADEPAPEVKGSIERDPANTGGELEVTIENDTVTFTSGEIKWYPEDKDLGRAAGNRVGVQINAPADFDTTGVTVKIGEQTYNWDEIEDGDGYFWWYPLVTEAGQQFTATVVWNESSTQEFKVVIGEGVTLEPAPDTTDPELVVVSPEAGDIQLGYGETFKLEVTASDENLYELEVDHSFEGPCQSSASMLANLIRMVVKEKLLQKQA
jgi:hypothetical protein